MEGLKQVSDPGYTHEPSGTGALSRKLQSAQGTWQFPALASGTRRKECGEAE
ncbi:Hypothetical predicted protein, partial [Marmota monax]